MIRPPTKAAKLRLAMWVATAGLIGVVLLATVWYSCALWRVRRYVLLRAENARSTPLSESLLREGPSDVSVKAHFPSKERAISEISLYLQCPDWCAPHKQLAIDALGECGEKAQSILLGFSRHKHPVVRAHVLMALRCATSDSHELVPVFVAGLHDNDRQVRIWAASALGACGRSDAIAINALVEALDDGDSLVRCASIESLEAVITDTTAPNVAHAIKSLEGLLRTDPSESVRSYAASALKALQASHDVGPQQTHVGEND
jgi:hypothetical protein